MYFRPMFNYLYFFCLLCGCMVAQNTKGFCKVTKVTAEAFSQSKITFKFINPQGKPATSRVAFKMNNDTVISPVIDKTGTFVMALNPGTYYFTFFVKFWYDVESKPIILKPKTNTHLTVKFEPVEIGTTPVK